MGKVNYAAIDIGSNAVRLLIKSIDREAVQEKKIKKVMMLRVPLRLGFDVFSIGELSEKKADKLRRLMKAFRQLMKIYDVDDYRACATSAMRDARNGRTIIKKIEKDTGIRIEIIDGQEEARMIYNNHIECMEDRLGNYMYVDVGGGSTEINLLTNGELVWSVSYNIGTVRMLSNAVKEGTWQQMEEELMKDNKIKAGSIVMDLGSGQGITSVFLAKEYGFKVYATDLWSDAEENRKFFTEMGLTEDQIIPVKADATGLKYEKEFFDAVVSTDSYNYFGRDEKYLDEKLLPFVKKGGYIYIVVPGMKKDCHNNIPKELLLSWTPEQLDYIHDIEYWKNNIPVIVTDREELAKYYARADLFLFPSLYDASSIVQIEEALQKTGYI